MAAAYRIEDEPRPGAWAHLAVRPLWPLFAVMFAGVWLAWPWFVWNGWVVGSPTRNKELAWAAGGALGLVGLATSLAVLASAGVLPSRAQPYAYVLLILWKLGVTYALYFLQSRTFQLYEHYGGLVKSGLILVALGYFARSWLLQHGLWALFS
jgi:hypothetical protein